MPKKERRRLVTEARPPDRRLPAQGLQQHARKLGRLERLDLAAAELRVERKAEDEAAGLSTGTVNALLLRRCAYGSATSRISSSRRHAIIFE
jgi:hypothetical protein